MLSPEGPHMCVHAFVGVSMRDNKSKPEIFGSKKVCVCVCESPFLTYGQAKTNHPPPIADHSISVLES